MSGVCDPSGDTLILTVGGMLLTGTGIVPDEAFSPPPGELVTIDRPTTRRNLKEAARAQADAARL
jgi:hypothetical protein